jgi:hypothetical protein
MNEPVIFTVLETAPQHPRSRRPRAVLAKHRGPGPDEEQDYDAALNFLFRRLSVVNSAETFAFLRDLGPQPHKAIIRGQPLPGVDLSLPQRRLIHPQEGTKPTIAAGLPVGWAAFDLDKSLPADGIDWRMYPREAAHAIVLRDLPPWVTEADLVVYWSASQGFKPHMKLRAFVLLERPLTSSELKTLMKQSGCPVDLALYNDAQLHYTATPIFLGAVADPLPGGRHYLFEGKRRRAIPPPLPPTPPPPPRAASFSAAPFACISRVHGAPAYAVRSSRIIGGRGGTNNARIMAAIDSMGDGEEKQGFHQPWISAIALFYAQNGPDADPRPLIAKLRRRIIECGTRPAGYVERETLGMVRRARVLAARERERVAVKARLSAAAPTYFSRPANEEKHL